MMGEGCRGACDCASFGTGERQCLPFRITPDGADERGLRWTPYTLQPVPGDHDARLDLGGLLAAVENASPVAAADVLAERLTDALGASEVSFLVADFSGRALVRRATPTARRPAEPRGAKRRSASPWWEARTAAR